jgi:hypothetical protein
MAFHGCPKCDFERVSAPPPVSRGDGRLQCRKCGTTWKSLGNAVPVVMADSFQHEQGKTHAQREALIGKLAARLRGRSPKASSLAMEFTRPAAIVFGAALVSALFFQSGLFGGSGQGKASLAITALNVRQLQRDGQIAVKVEGRIVNRSTQRAPVGEIRIVLTETHGHKVYSWNYRPAVAWLEAGQSFRFSTANGSVPQPVSSVEVRSGEAQSISKL